MDKQLNVEIRKTDAVQQTATGLVFSPMVLDSQDDFMTADGIKAASERFMKAGRTSAIDVNHDGMPINAFISENMIAAGDDDFPAGSWIVTAKIEDPDIWKQVADGELTGFSMAGTGGRNATTLRGKAATQITNLDVFSISLVDKPANKTKFSVLKGETGVSDFDAAVAGLLKVCLEIQKGFESAGSNAAKSSRDTTEAVLKAHAQEEIGKAAKVKYWERKISHLQDKWEQLIERPDLRNFGGRESSIREQIEEAEVELIALGKNQGDEFFVSASAFTGMSAHLEVTPDAFGSNDLGLRGPVNEIVKGGGPLGNNTMGIREDYDDEYIDLCGMKV